MILLQCCYPPHQRFFCCYKNGPYVWLCWENNRNYKLSLICSVINENFFPLHNQMVLKPIFQINWAAFFYFYNFFHLQCFCPDAGAHNCSLHLTIKIYNVMFIFSWIHNGLLMEDIEIHMKFLTTKFVFWCMTMFSVKKQ